MSDRMYKIMMVILAVVFISQVIAIIITPPPVVACVNGYIMEQHNLMWVQKGILPQHCVLVDPD